MINLENTISEIREDLVLDYNSREEFLAICAKERIEDVSKKYDERFDKLLSMIDERDSVNGHDFVKLSYSIRIFSDLINNLYSKLSRDVNIYSKLYGVRNDK